MKITELLIYSAKVTIYIYNRKKLKVRAFLNVSNCKGFFYSVKKCDLVFPWKKFSQKTKHAFNELEARRRDNLPV